MHPSGDVINSYVESIAQKCDPIETHIIRGVCNSWRLLFAQVMIAQRLWTHSATRKI